MFGVHGGQVNVTDGRYVYMRGPARADNAPLSEYTLMPTHMRALKLMLTRMRMLMLAHLRMLMRSPLAGPQNVNLASRTKEKLNGGKYCPQKLPSGAEKVTRVTF